LGKAYTYLRMRTSFLLMISAVVSLPFNASGTAGSSKGVDLAGKCSESTLSCLVKDGYTFGIFRAWHSTGTFDTDACPSVVAAHSAGMTNVDVYMFPCAKCSASASNQMTNMINSLKSAGCTQGSGKGTFGKVWLDIEGTQYWPAQSSAQAFFNGLLSACKSLSLNCGVYSSASQWNPIFGSSFSAGSSLPLWYAHYDGNPSFSDFASFGGWHTPYMKQYNGDKTACGFDVDFDWTPNTPDTNFTM